jgi:hypothetical protein
VDLPSSPTPSLPNPYTTSLRRTRTASSAASSTRTSSSIEFGPRPRPKPTLTLSLANSKPSAPTVGIPINDSDSLLPNPFQPQANQRKYFSPHTPARPPNVDPPILIQATSSLGSGLLAPPPGATIGSYWSPHTPDIPEALKGAIEEALVEEPEEIPVKEAEGLVAGSKQFSGTAADGHAGPPSLPPSPDSVYPDSDMTTSDSSSKPSKPQLTLQTWDLDKMREEKRRQESTAARRQGSREKDARNRERKEKERTVQKQPEMIVQTAEATKGGAVPRMLKPGGDLAARLSRPLPQAAGSNNAYDGRGKVERPPLPAALRPNSQLFPTSPPPAQSAHRSQPVLDILEEPSTQGSDASARLTQNRRSIATTIAWALAPNAPPQQVLTPDMPNPFVSANSNPDRDWSGHGQRPSGPSVAGLSVPGVAGTQGAELGRSGRATEREQIGFFGNAGGAASDTNLAASSAPAPVQKESMDGKGGNDPKENRKSAFYARGINASFEALAGWGGKVFSHSSTVANTHAHGHPSKTGEMDEKAPCPGTAPLPATTLPNPFAQPQTTRLATPPLTDTQQYQYTTPRHTPPPDARVYPPPSYPPGERGPSFEDFGVEIGRAGRNRTHTPPHSIRGRGAADHEPAVAGDVQQMRKGHAKNSSSGVGGLKKIFGFGKKDKDKDKQKWV